jgi:hypothetical protein
MNTLSTNTSMPPTVCEQYLGRKIANLVDERIGLLATVEPTGHLSGKPTNEMVRRLIHLRGQDDRGGSF